MTLEISIDLETRSAVDLKKTGVYPYAAHPTTDVWCLAFQDDDAGVCQVWRPGEYLPPQFLDPRVTFRAWNANFERQIWHAILVARYGFPPVPLERWVCTMAEALAMGLPGSLDKAGEALGVEQQKDKAGAGVMMRMAKPRRVQPDGTIVWWDDAERRATLEAYCQQDVRAERAIARQVRRLSATERAVWLLDQQINDRGVGVDLPLVAALSDLEAAARADADRRMRELTGGAVKQLTQAGALKSWLSGRGLDLEGVAKDDVRDALEDGELPADVEEVLLLRQEAGGTSSRKLVSMKASASRGSRIRGMLAYHGASTGRWAGRLVQPQNMPRGTIKHKHLEPSLPLVMGRNAAGLEMLFGSIHHVVPSALRACFRAEAGNQLYAGDYSQIEARVLPWLSGAEHVLDVFRSGKDIYQTTADAMGVDRQIGKVAVLALGFQGGKGAFQNMAKVYGLKVTDEQADEFKVKWREANPEAVAMWDEVQQAALNAVRWGNPTEACAGKIHFYMEGRDWLVCELPSTRKLWYSKPHIVKKLTPWGREVDELRAWGVDSFTKKWASYSLYGGLLTENIVQAVARDIMAGAMLRLDRAGYPPILTVHDEVICETPAGFGSVAEFTDIMTVTPKWAAGLPIKAEAWAGTRYRK